MTAGHAAGRRRRFAPRAHELGARSRAPEVHSVSYRVAGASAGDAITAAKVQAKAEGWVLRTVSGCRPATDTGLWIVSFAAVRA